MDRTRLTVILCALCVACNEAAESSPDAATAPPLDASPGLPDVGASAAPDAASVDLGLAPDAEPVYWAEDSHSGDAPPDFERAFPQDRVVAMTLRVAPETWTAMHEDLLDVVSPDDSGRPHACDDLELGDPCEADWGTGRGAEDGVCLETHFGLDCVPDRVEISLAANQACAQARVGEPCALEDEVSVCVSDRITPFCLSTRQAAQPCFLKREGSPCWHWLGRARCVPHDEVGLVCVPDEAEPCEGRAAADTCLTNEWFGTCREQLGALACLPPGAEVQVCGDRAEGHACSSAQGEGVCVEHEAQLYCQVDGYDRASLREVPVEAAVPFWTRKPEYFPAEVEVEGRVWRHVGLRFKGNNSLAQSLETHARPYRLNFDKYEDDHPEIDDQRFWGYDKLSLGNNITDPTRLRQHLAAELFREGAGVGPRTALYEVTLVRGEEVENLGVYTMTEVIDDPFLDAHYDSNDGNLYKPDGKGAHFWSFEQGSFHRRNHEESTDFSDIEAFIEALHADQGDRSAWRARLREVFVIDDYLRVLAMNQAMANWDTYGYLAHNFYLYGDPALGGALRWIPWDFDLAFDRDSDLSLTTFDGRWPLIQAVARDPELMRAYQRHLVERALPALDPTHLGPRLDALVAMIRPAVRRGGADEAAFEEAVEALRAHLEQRYEHTHAYLNLWGLL